MSKPFPLDKTPWIRIRFTTAPIQSTILTRMARAVNRVFVDFAGGRKLLFTHAALDKFLSGKPWK